MLFNLVYGLENAPFVSTPGLYWNESLGLLSMSTDGTNWTTISDKNLGATVAYDGVSTMSEANCGKYYERGNNYGFPFSGPATVSGNKVDASNYGPGNYYSGSTFISNNDYYWDSSGNGNLRGWEDGTDVARQGPCEVGFHIPTSSEWTYMTGILITLGMSSSNIKTFLKIPACGYIAWNANIARRNSYICLWTCENSSTSQAYAIDSYSPTSNFSNISEDKAQGFNIRPFKNVAVQPNINWTLLYPNS